MTPCFWAKRTRALAGAVHQLGVGWEGDRFLLDRGVHDHLLEVGGLGGSRAGCDDKAPVDRARKLHQRVIEGDDLVEPGPEEIRLPGLPTLLRPHESPRRHLDQTRGSRSASQIKLQENQSTTPANRQTRILPESRNSRQIKALGVLHGRHDSYRLSELVQFSAVEVYSAVPRTSPPLDA